jgi:hypothetical protein
MFCSKIELKFRSNMLAIFQEIRMKLVPFVSLYVFFEVLFGA